MEFYIPSFLDVVDIALLAVVLYQIYRMFKGTASVPIFIVIALIYLLWVVTAALDMELISMLLDEIIGVGMIALVVVFQQEIRRFLLYIGSKYLHKFGSFFGASASTEGSLGYIDEVVKACERMSASKTGALIVFSRKQSLSTTISTGDVLRCSINARLLESIFFKNAPLHDGAVIIERDKIVAARSVLPSTERADLPAHLGMRHRAALGISEQTDALVVVVSEESGRISIIENGTISTQLQAVGLKEKLIKGLTSK